MTESSPVPKWLTRDELSKFLTANGFRISAKTLAQYASREHVQGPPYTKFNGRALYEQDESLAWARSRLPPKAVSTSEHRDIATRRAVA